MTGYTTIHAGTARQALTRLRFIAQLAETSSALPMSALNHLVSEAIDIVVHCARTDGKVEVTEILAVEDLQAGLDSSAFTTTTLFDRATPGAPLKWTGNIPTRAGRAIHAVGYDIRNLRDDTEHGQVWT